MSQVRILSGARRNSRSGSIVPVRSRDAVVASRHAELGGHGLADHPVQSQENAGDQERDERESEQQRDDVSRSDSHDRRRDRARGDGARVASAGRLLASGLMAQFRIRTAADLLGVSDDTVRRWIEQGRLTSAGDESGRQVVDGVSLAERAQQIAAQNKLDDLDQGVARRSARNHLTGLVTKVTSDQVMSQVELQCGPFRVVSLISTEAVEQLGLEVGSLATAVVKATNVSIEGTLA